MLNHDPRVDKAHATPLIHEYAPAMGLVIHLNLYQLSLSAGVEPRLLIMYD